jgi:hypothetical protein
MDVDEVQTVLLVNQIFLKEEYKSSPDETFEVTLRSRRDYNFGFLRKHIPRSWWQDEKNLQYLNFIRSSDGFDNNELVMDDDGFELEAAGEQFIVRAMTVSIKVRHFTNDIAVVLNYY